ncbi:MAG: tRNA (N6-isopentenyl adenosine(37)-C2)-methylthiotransferase MiaB [Bacillota bacterium]
MKYLVETWGCQMNEHDSDVLAGMLEEIGYQKASDEKEADLVILNTCCVREKAENKVYGKLGKLGKLKREKTDLLIGVCGCMTQQPEAARDISRRAPYVDLIFGTHNTHRLKELVEEARNSASTLVEVWEQEGEIVENLPINRQDGLKAYITITYGCNNFCTYCIVPHVRGRERSRKPGDVIKEVMELAGEGYMEVMLLGQNVNSYGKDLEGHIDFASLLLQASEVEGIRRIRFMTSHPKDFSGRLIEAIATNKNICNQVHLPIQAGSNAVLKRMNRGYTRETYLELVDKLREQVPDVTLTTDLIVGFPGETDQDFEETLDLLKRVGFDNAYTFIYSPRTGTPACQLPDQLPLDAKKARLQELMQVQNAISLEINQQMIGKTEEVLVEGRSKGDPDKLSGRTEGNKIVVFAGHEDLVGKLIDVKIEDAHTWNLVARIANE